MACLPPIPLPSARWKRALAAYSALLGVRLEPSFPDGVEVLLDWRLTDLLLLLFAAVSGLVLLTGERSAGLMVLLRPTRRGHGALYWRKAAAMLATVLAGVVLLYGANLAVSSAVLGLGDPARPIQTIPSMQSCPVPLTVFGWLLCFVGEKLLWGWAVGALFFLLCTTTGRAWAAFLLAGGGAGLALLLGSRGSLWPRLLSLSRAAEVEESWRGCIYLNFFGLPLRQTGAASRHAPAADGGRLPRRRGGVLPHTGGPAGAPAPGPAAAAPAAHGAAGL